MVILEAKHVDHALAVDKDVIGATGGILPIGAHLVERAFQPIGDRALGQLQAANLALRAEGLTPTAIQLDIRESNGFNHLGYAS
jgi:hypothetical protein